MKNIWNKIYIHPLTLLIIFSACISGMFNELIVLFLIIIIHELGHLLIALKYKYKISKIEFFPFGGIIKCEKDINSPIKEEIVLSTMGIIFQIILSIIIAILFNLHIIRYRFLSLFFRYNVILLLFNLLPIIPLDGYILLKSILELYFPYKNSFIISLIISFIILIIFIVINITYNLNNYIIIGFFLYKVFESIKKFKYTQIRFYLERIIKGYNFSKVKIIDGISIEKMFKEKKHYFLNDNQLISEEAILRKKFDIKGNFW